MCKNPIKIRLNYILSATHQWQQVEYSVHVLHRQGHVREALLSRPSPSNRHMITRGYQVIMSTARLRSCAIMHIRGLATVTVLPIAYPKPLDFSDFYYALTMVFHPMSTYI